jgi:hypothetical protein
MSDDTIKPRPGLAGPANLPGNQMRGKAGGPIRLSSPPKCPGCGTDTELDPTDPEGRRGKLCEVCQMRADSRAKPEVMFNLSRQTGVNVNELRDGPET